MRRIRFIVALVSMAAALAVAAPPAQAMPDFLKKIFSPMQRDFGPDPSDTLQAPFAEQGQAPVGGLDSLYGQPGAVPAQEDTKDLSQPHRQQEEISAWLVRAVSEILNVNADDYEGHLAHLATGMDEGALVDFKTFMDSSNILQTLKSGNYKIHSYVEGAPLLLNKGAVAERYRWLFEMPVMLTFLSRDAQSYKTASPYNQYVLIQVQVGRVAEGQGADALMIETFKVRQNPDHP